MNTADFIGMNGTVVVIQNAIDTVLEVENMNQIYGKTREWKVDDTEGKEMRLVGIDGVVLIGTKQNTVKSLISDCF